MIRVPLLHMLAAFFLSLGATGLAPAPLQAQETTLDIPKGGIDADAPLEITGDSLAVEEGGAVAIFTGSVRLLQGETEMRAARMAALFAESEGGAGRQIVKAEAEGEVRLIRPGLEVRADRAIYDVEANRAVFTGHVFLDQGPITMEGSHLELDLETGKAVFSGRVRTIIKGAGIKGTGINGTGATSQGDSPGKTSAEANE